MIHTSNWIWKSMEKFILPCLLKTSTKLQQKSMFYKSVIKQQIQYVIFNTKVRNFFYKVPTFQNCVFTNVFNFPKLSLLDVHKSPSTWTKKQNSTRIQNSNPQLSNGLFLSIMPCKPQKLCNMPTPLTYTHV